jgi:hypothetical protein
LSPKAVYISSRENAYSLEDQRENSISSSRSIRPGKPASVSTFDTLNNDKSEFLQLSIPFEFPKLDDFEEKVPVKDVKRDMKL